VEIEVHGLGLDVVQERHEVRQAPAKAIHVPRHDLIEFATSDAFQQSVEAGAPITPFGAGDAFIGQDGDDIPSLTLGDSVEFEELVFDRLIIG